MKNVFAGFLFAAALVPFAAAPALAQSENDGPPPAVRAQMQQLHATAKAETFNALSASHRAAVQGIIDRVNAGTLDRKTGASQIDALLSPAETQAVLAEGKKMHDTMRHYFEQHPMPAGEHMGQMEHKGSHHRMHDAGHMLLMLGSNHPDHAPGKP